MDPKICDYHFHLYLLPSCGSVAAGMKKFKIVLWGPSNVAVGVNKKIYCKQKRFAGVCKYILYVELTFIHN